MGMLMCLKATGTSKVGPHFQRTEPGSSPAGVSPGASRLEMRLECEQQAGWLGRGRSCAPSTVLVDSGPEDTLGAKEPQS